MLIYNYARHAILLLSMSYNFFFTLMAKRYVRCTIHAASIILTVFSLNYKHKHTLSVRVKSTPCEVNGSNRSTYPLSAA